MLLFLHNGVRMMMHAQSEHSRKMTGLAPITDASVGAGDGRNIPHVASTSLSTNSLTGHQRLFLFVRRIVVGKYPTGDRRWRPGIYSGLAAAPLRIDMSPQAI